MRKFENNFYVNFENFNDIDQILNLFFEYVARKYISKTSALIIHGTKVRI